MPNVTGTPSDTVRTTETELASHSRPQDENHYNGENASC